MKKNSEILSEMSSSKINNLIRCVNDNTPRNEVSKHFTPDQMKIFDDWSKELKDIRKKYPKANFSPVEKEW